MLQAKVTAWLRNMELIISRLYSTTDLGTGRGVITINVIFNSKVFDAKTEKIRRLTSR